MTSGPYRIPHGSTGAAINHDRRVRFHFDGKTFEGFEGDTLASALLANGVRTIGRSFKFHRPRGVYSCGLEEPNAFVQHGAGAHSVPSTRSTLLEVHEGLEAFSHAHRRFDIARIFDFTARLWPAGFYNKTFIWPNWHTYEWLIRRMAGFGYATSVTDPDRYDTRNIHCDVLIVGAGTTGLQAAITAAGEGTRVLLVNQSPQLGGRCTWDSSIIDGTPGPAWTRAAIARLKTIPDVKILPNTTAVGCYDHNVVTLVEQISGLRTQASALPRERLWIVRAKHIILATGAIEQPLIFDNNDRPGIMLAGAAREYLHRYGVAIGHRVLIATNNDSAYALARDLNQAGVEVVAIADTRHEVPQELAIGMRELSIPLLSGSIPTNTTGFSALTGVTIGRLVPAEAGTQIESTQHFRCDALAVSGGWNPSLHLYSQVGGKLQFNESTRSLSTATSGAFWPATRHTSIDVVAAAAAQAPGLNTQGLRISPIGKTHRQFVDLRHDVTVADLELAVREGYTSIEHVKRYTTVGMAADQGKTSNVAALEIVAKVRGIDPSKLGHTTFRPPFTPVTLGAIAGRSIDERFAPSRRTPLHDWHIAHRAVLEDYGEWKRPAVYLRTGESRHHAIRREATNVRTTAGLFDGSPLGKIEIHGPDALQFLDRFYINNLKTLKFGRVRYGLMLREIGTILDDGTIVMLAPDRFLITTTSGNANRITAWLEEWHQCEWPQLRLAITQVTEQWAVLSLTGPRAKDILSKLDTDIELANEAFPHLTVREGQLLGLPTRIYRVSFSGELTYEINVPARAAEHVWKTILATGAPYSLEPFGLEALLLMRLEKGYLHIGTDTDGTTVPDDIGYAKIASSKQADFIGKRSLSLPENVRPDRLQLVGLRPEASGINANALVNEFVVGSHLRIPGTKAATDGWITSAGRSVLTAEPIAMAMLRGGKQRLGEQVSVHNADNVTGATVVNLPFFDPTGERMNG